MRRNQWMNAVLSGALALACGCSGGPFDYVPASGSVTYEDGSLIPADRLMVTFVPQVDSAEGKIHPPNAVAEVNSADGSFQEVTSHQFGDGLLAGRHKVQIVALDAAQNPTSAVPREYASVSTTPLEVDTANRPFELKVRKPNAGR